MLFIHRELGWSELLMTIRFKCLPIGGQFLFRLHSVDYIGRKVVSFRVLSKDGNKFHKINAFLMPKDKCVHGSGGVVATIPRRGRVLIAA